MRVRLALISLLVVCLVGCSGFMQMRDSATPQVRYFAALDHYNGLLNSYIMQYKEADQATQLKWKEKVTPIFLSAGSVLSLWRSALYTQEGDPYVQEQDYIVLRKQILACLLRYGILEVKND